MLVLILFNIGIILWIYFNFYKENKELETYDENIKNIEPLEMGYINDRRLSNNFDSILAEIINLNIKGYLDIEYNGDKTYNDDYIIKQRFDTPTNNINNYELLILKFLFSKKTEITKNELEKMIECFDSYDIQFNELEDGIENKLITENVISKSKKEKIQNIKKVYKRISFLLIIILLILNITNSRAISSNYIIMYILQTMSLGYIIIYILEIIITYILILKADFYTNKGKNLKSQIVNYKKEILNKEFLIDNKSMAEIVNEKEFANSLALHINTVAKDTFVYNKITDNMASKSKKVLLKVISVFLVILVAFLLLRKAILTVDSTGKFFIFVTLIIIIAAWADITHELASFKNINKK